MWGYLLLIQKNSITLLLTCMVFQFIWKKNFLFHGTLENSILTYVFDWLYLRVFLLFSLLITLSLYKAFDVVSSNIDKVLSINLFANMFDFKGFNVHHNIVSVSINFPSNSKQDASFYRMAYDYSRTDWDGLHDHLSYVSWGNIFKLNAYQVKPHSSLWFSAAWAVP